MTPGILPMTPKQSGRVLSGLVRHSPRRKKIKFQRSRIKYHVDNFFDSQGVLHKEFVPEGKTVNAEFYKGVMGRLLKRIQRVRPSVFCSRDFFLLHDNAPSPHKAASVCQFLTKKKTLQPFITLPPSVLYRFISARIFSVPQVENGVKRTPPCGC